LERAISNLFVSAPIVRVDDQPAVACFARAAYVWIAHRALMNQKPGHTRPGPWKDADPSSGIAVTRVLFLWERLKNLPSLAICSPRWKATNSGETGLFPLCII